MKRPKKKRKTNRTKTKTRIEGPLNPLLTRRDELLADLQLWPDAHARLEYLMDLARERPALAAEFQIEELRVEGCISNLWIRPEFRDGRCWFPCDADSMVVKSIAGLLCAFYSDAAPADILALDPTFLKEAGITQHLSSNRRNALTRVWGVIRNFAAQHLPA